MAVASFPHAASVPILGQPVDVLGWTLVVSVRCKCEHESVVALILNQSSLNRAAVVGICPACARAMHIEQVTAAPDGQLQFSINVGTTAATDLGTPS